MRLYPVVFGLLLVGGLAAPLAFGGCKSKGDDGGRAAKVDCDKLCARTFGQCVDQVLVASGRVKQQKVALLKKIGVYKKVKKEGRDSCLKGCRDKKGRFRDSQAVNQCLAIKGCGKFAACITKHVR